MRASISSNLRSATGDVGKIQVALVEARLAQSAGAYDAEVATLQRAVALEDGLGYSEPPAFWYPVRETLGAAYLLAGHSADAERTFRADLKRNPENPRSLYGLAQTLAHEGQALEAQRVHVRFVGAWKGAQAPPDIANM